MSAADDTIGVVEVVITNRTTTHFQTGPNVEYWWRRGILMTDGSEPIFKWFDLEGNLQRIIRIEGLDPEPVTAEEREAIRRTGSELLESTSDESRRRSVQRRLDYPIPDVKHYWAYVTVDESGFIWAMEPTDFIHTFYSGVPCKIIGPEGEYLGDVTFPEVEGLRSASPSRGYLLARVEDLETGAYSLHVYRINPAVRGLSYP